MPAKGNAFSIDADEDARGATYYSVVFSPHAVARLAKAIVRAGRPLNGYAVEAVMIYLSEKGDPSWGAELEFDSENEMFCVRCRKKRPLEHLVRRLEKRLAN